MSRPVAFITGASSGIGEAFARKLALRGYDLALVARRQERLDSLAADLRGPVGTVVETICADLATEQGVSQVEAKLLATPKLELLVNNAGYGTKGLFWENAVEASEQMHRLHVMATVRLSHAALRNMVPRDEGAIINISSVAGFVRSAGNVSYCATKTWMNAFTEALYLELQHKHSHVRVQALCPGFTYSEFHDVMGVSRDPIPKYMWMKAGFVVDESLRGLERAELFVIPGRHYRWFTRFFTRLPQSWRLAVEKGVPSRRGRV